MEFEVVPAFAVPLDEQARVANAGFANYVGGWSDLDAQTLSRFLLLQGADLFYSRFVRLNGELAGFGYITRTGNISRLSGMAMIPGARGTGAAGHLLETLCREAQELGDAAMVLEVIEQNPRAHAVYLRHGFRDLTRLTGWRWSAGVRGQTTDAPKLMELPVLDALRQPSTREYPEIPWQISRHAIAKVPRVRTFRVGDACVFISDRDAKPTRIYGFLADTADVEPLREAVRALQAQFADVEFFAPPIWPEQFSCEVFEPLGFRREQLSQFFMRRDFAPPQ